MKKEEILRNYHNKFLDFLSTITKNRFITSSSLQKITDNEKNLPIQIPFHKMTRIFIESLKIPEINNDPLKLSSFEKNSFFDSQEPDQPTMHLIVLMKFLMLNREKSFDKLVKNLKLKSNDPAYFQFPENFFQDHFQERFLPYTEFSEKYISKGKMFEEKFLQNNINQKTIENIFQPFFNIERNLLTRELISLLAYFEAFLKDSCEAYIAFTTDFDPQKKSELISSTDYYFIYNFLRENNLLLLEEEIHLLLEEVRKRRNLIIHNNEKVNNHYRDFMIKKFNITLPINSSINISDSDLEILSSHILNISRNMFIKIIKT